MLARIGLLTVASVLLAAGQAGAAVIPVTTTTDEYGGATLTECSLREAVQAANTNSPFGGCPAGSGADEITLPAGTYGFTQSGAEPIGGSVGVRDLDVDGALTITGQGGPTIDANDLDRVFELTSGDSLTLRGMTLTDGRAEVGGAIRVQLATLSLVDVVVDLNTATSPMGASAVGGGIWAQLSTVSITGSRITNNSVASEDAAEVAIGGGIQLFGGTLTMTDTVVSGNSAQDHGGGIDAIQDGVLTLTNSTITENRALDGDGIAVRAGATGTLTNVTIADNGQSVFGKGGGLYADPRDAEDVIALENVTFSNNLGGSVGGSGGSIYVVPTALGEVTARNTIAAHPLAGGNCGGKPLSYTNGHNLEYVPGGVLSCFSQETDPTTVYGDPAFPRNSVGNLAPPADNGGPTPTIALGPGSAAVDAGVPVAGITTDQRGSPRPSGSAPDIGAYELFVPPAPPPPGTPPPTGGGTGGPTLPAGCDIAGTPGNDVIAGTRKGERICGLGGNDVIKGLGGNDVLIGGSGNDVLIGGKGNDRLVGGAGKDRFLGGAGKDFLAMKDKAKEFGDGGPGIDTATTNRGDRLKRVEKRR